MELTDLSATELARGYRAKEFSPSDVTEAYFAHIEKNNRARTRENNFKDVRKMFDKKNGMITDTCK